MPSRVLIVDDAQFMRNLLRDIFSSAGWEIAGEAADGHEAWQKYQEVSPDLVTMDIVMPERNGIEALQDIIAIDSRALVVMCSALGQESMVMEALQNGARDFIVKPFKREQVLEVVRRVMG
ncbi:response regulator [Geopsychrobacter electrodiphilus]|uniref:response regulator n=1 Tax=Geopsychrobacter electrodiphilus TaxID=225196 RepID=UPI0003A12C6D|nr:response regulator [Geopsychrobacter electrodiphilus]